MKYITLIFLFGLVISFQSCQKDILGDENIEEVIQTEPTTTTTVSTGVSGIATDENGQALEGITISYSRETYTTDENGYFRIKNIKAGTEGGILVFQESGYFNNYKFFIPELNETSFVRVRMIPKSNPENFNAENGGIVNINGGGSIVFPPNAIKVEASGAPYNGEVSVYTHWYNPEGPYLEQSMPGDLRGLSADGQLVQLSTYGMMAVELFSSDNQKLNLADDTTATLKFPLPESTKSHAPETIETWSLNEQTVYWEEESTAQLDGDFYITEVSHFSFWNCDVPFPLVNITGKLVNQDGVPLTNFSICIDIVSNGSTGYGWTNSAGNFNGKVPQDEALVLRVKDECGQIILNRNIGPFSNDVSFGEIVIDIEAEIIISGQLQCNGNPITNGYARICLNDMTCYIAETDAQGNFSQSIIQCESVNSFTIQGFDLSDFRSSEIESFVITNGADINVGVIESCNELEEYIRFKIDNSSESLILNPSANITNGVLSIRGVIDSLETLFQADITDAQVSDTNIPSYVEAYLYDPNTQNFLDARCNLCEDFIFDITELGGLGEKVIGTFMGEIDGIVVMGSFKIDIDDISDSLDCRSSVSPTGDCNEASLIITISGGKFPYQVFRDDIFVETINIGVFTITGLTNGDEGTYRIVDDNGVSCDGEYLIEYETISCNPTSIDASCGDDNGSATVFVNGGSGAYTYQWSNGATTPQITGLSSGLYSVTITDSNGCPTECSITIAESEELLVEFETNGPFLCSVENSFITASAFGGSGSYTYSWSNGAIGATISNLTEGIYTVIVTDNSNNCNTTAEFFLEYTLQEIEAEVSSTVDGCDMNGLPFGSFNIQSINGGTPPYSILWTNASTTVTSESIDVSFQDNITLIVQDENDCVFTMDYTYEPSDYRSISGTVWSDNNGITANVLDSLDGRVIDLEVFLIDPSNPQDPLQVTTTDENGNYIFLNISEGSYIVRVPLNAGGSSYVIPNIGNDENIDSDVNGNDGTTEVIIHDGCEKITNINAGMQL